MKSQQYKELSIHFYQKNVFLSSFPIEEGLSLHIGREDINDIVFNDKLYPQNTQF